MLWLHCVFLSQALYSDHSLNIHLLQATCLAYLTCLASFTYFPCSACLTSLLNLLARILYCTFRWLSLTSFSPLTSFTALTLINSHTLCLICIPSPTYLHTYLTYLISFFISFLLTYLLMHLVLGYSCFENMGTCELPYRYWSRREARSEVNYVWAVRCLFFVFVLFVCSFCFVPGHMPELVVMV